MFSVQYKGTDSEKGPFYTNVYVESNALTHFIMSSLFFPSHSTMDSLNPATLGKAF